MNLVFCIAEIGNTIEFDVHFVLTEI